MEYDKTFEVGAKYGEWIILFGTSPTERLDLHNMATMLQTMAHVTPKISVDVTRFEDGSFEYVVKTNGGVPDRIKELLDHPDENIALSVGENLVDAYNRSDDKERTIADFLLAVEDHRSG